MNGYRQWHATNNLLPTTWWRCVDSHRCFSGFPPL